MGNLAHDKARIVPCAPPRQICNIPAPLQALRGYTPEGFITLFHTIPEPWRPLRWTRKILHDPNTQNFGIFLYYSRVRSCRTFCINSNLLTEQAGTRQCDSGLVSSAQRFSELSLNFGLSSDECCPCQRDPKALGNSNAGFGHFGLAGRFRISQLIAPVRQIGFLLWLTHMPWGLLGCKSWLGNLEFLTRMQVTCEQIVCRTMPSAGLRRWPETLVLPGVKRNTILNRNTILSSKL